MFRQLPEFFPQSKRQIPESVQVMFPDIATENPDTGQVKELVGPGLCLQRAQLARLLQGLKPGLAGLSCRARGSEGTTAHKLIGSA